MTPIRTLDENTSAGEPDELEVKVLLVDDQAIIGEAVRRMLSHEIGVSFHYCGDPKNAMEMAEHIQPTVILQDLVMPGVDGLDLVSQYRNNQKLRDLPIIVLSSKEDPKIKSQAFAVGANDYLVKLPDAVELIARLRYHSRAYLAMKQRD
ncbi:MAG: response regulator, partial [Burkholderiales bacterium]